MFMDHNTNVKNIFIQHHLLTLSKLEMLVISFLKVGTNNFETLCMYKYIQHDPSYDWPITKSETVTHFIKRKS